MISVCKGQISWFFHLKIQATMLNEMLMRKGVSSYGVIRKYKNHTLLPKTLACSNKVQHSLQKV